MIIKRDISESKFRPTKCVLGANKLVDSKVDRANVHVDSSSLLNGTVLWQNTWECHKCSWIRARGLDGKFLKPIITKPTGNDSSDAKNVTILLDTRWKQRFRLSLENDTDTTFASELELYRVNHIIWTISY